MWTNEYTAISPLPAAAIWNALKALHEGRLTYEGADTFRAAWAVRQGHPRFRDAGWAGHI